MIEITGKINKFEIIDETIDKPIDKLKIIDRPNILTGKTYKIKSPLAEYSLYVTINDIELDGKKRPFEIFINSKSLEHQQWIIALTRLISSIFRQGNIDINFIVKELKSVFDPGGGYRKQHVIIPSLVAEIGYIIEFHMDTYCGGGNENEVSTGDLLEQCPSCESIAVKRENGCVICLWCGYSKCD